VPPTRARSRAANNGPPPQCWGAGGGCRGVFNLLHIVRSAGVDRSWFGTASAFGPDGPDEQDV
jgi:hypothetical protein